MVIIWATLAVVALSMFPGGDLLTWPVRIFVTYVHESMHALAAILTGGQVLSMSIRPDMSGMVMTSGGTGWLVSSAGYVGTTLVGAACLFLLKRNIPPQLVLTFFIAICLFSILYTGFSNVYGTLVALGLGALLLVAMAWLPTFVAAFMSVQLLINSFYDLKTLLILSTTSSTHTDAQNMEMYTGIPASMWALVWIGTSALLTYWILFRVPVDNQSHK
jgi:hypothetical protein